MKKALLAVGLLLLSSCSFVPSPHPHAALVYKDEYVIWADGYWCPYDPEPLTHKGSLILAGMDLRCGNKKALPPGVYLLNSSGDVVTPGEERETVEISKIEETRGCDRYQSQGLDCTPNFLFETETNDPLYDDEWGLSEQGLNIEQLWASGESSPDIRVAVVDTGTYCEHDDLGCVASFDGINGRGEQEDENGHGTHCAGTICARGDNAIGVSGVSQECNLFAAKFMGASGGGSLYAAVKSIQWAIEQDVHIISASWGSPYGGDVLEKAIKKADEAGVLFVVAAGNDNQDIDETPQYPASYDYPNVITVGSHTNSGARSGFSNYGKETVEVFAPGSFVISTWNDGGYRTISGTSMATPHISGLAALLWQRELGKGTKREQMLRVRDIIFSLGTKDLKEYSKYGIVRAKAEPSCKQRRCEKCVFECRERLKCQCGRMRNCKQKCFNESKCEKGCK